MEPVNNGAFRSMQSRRSTRHYNAEDDSAAQPISDDLVRFLGHRGVTLRIRSDTKEF